MKSLANQAIVKYWFALVPDKYLPKWARRRRRNWMWCSSRLLQRLDTMSNRYGISFFSLNQNFMLKLLILIKPWFYLKFAVVPSHRWSSARNHQRGWGFCQKSVIFIYFDYETRCMLTKENIRLSVCISHIILLSLKNEKVVLIFWKVIFWW